MEGQPRDGGTAEGRRDSRGMEGRYFWACVFWFLEAGFLFLQIELGLCSADVCFCL